MKFPETLKTLMIDRDLKQADLCRATGIPTSLMSNYINGVKFPSLTNSVALSQALGISIDALAGVNSNCSIKPQIDKVQEKDELLERLLENYYEMNAEGRERLVDTSDDMVVGGKYKKHDNPEMGREA